MGKVVRHTRILEATKEIFAPFIGGVNAQAGSTFAGIGGYPAYLINTDGDYAYAMLYIPWDFSKLTRAVVVFIPATAVTPMSFRVVTDYCLAEHAYFDHFQLNNYNVDTVNLRLQEREIAESLVALTDNAPLEAGDYLGVQVSRQVGQTISAYFLGVRLRYNTPLYAKAP